MVQIEKEKKEQEQEVKILRSWAPFISSPISRTAAPTYATAASSLRKRYVSSSLCLSGLPPSLFVLSRLEPRRRRALVSFVLGQGDSELECLRSYPPLPPSIPPSLPPEVRGQGVGTIMALSFLRLARDLGYKASYFNLVFGG